MLQRKPNSGMFQKGNTAAVGYGRPPGARAELSQLALRLIADDFGAHGAEVLETVRKTKPAAYLQAICSLLPRQVQKLDNIFADITDSELSELEEHLALLRARTIEKLHALEQRAAEPKKDDGQLELAAEPVEEKS